MFITGLLVTTFLTVVATAAAGVVDESFRFGLVECIRPTDSIGLLVGAVASPAVDGGVVGCAIELVDDDKCSLLVDVCFKKEEKTSSWHKKLKIKIEERFFPN